MRKNLENLGYLFSKKDTRNFYENGSFFKKIFGEFWRNLINFEEIYWKFRKKFQVARNFWNIVMTFRWNFKAVLMRLNRIFTQILLELWKYFEKNEILGIFCRNKFQDNENLERTAGKRWRNFRVTLEKFWLNLKNREEILK